ncbi:MAG: 2-oxoacid:acceptor oxidoreductase family protein [Planctomycetes bacterium]|nr:2-oxoacid:acceptor oxidoreductase family protein [Planctomycetota bacterium]
MTRIETAPPPTIALREIRLVGRGGQGVVTAGELLGEAALLDGQYAQSIPAFGPERRGALATCVVRLADGEILLRCSAGAPDVLVVIDPTIWKLPPALLGLKPDATLLFNTTRPPGELPKRPQGRVGAIDATGIALAHLGRPIPNTAMLGAFAGATGLVRMESLEEVFRRRFPGKADGNIAAARAASEAILWA